MQIKKKFIILKITESPLGFYEQSVQVERKVKLEWKIHNT